MADSLPIVTLYVDGSCAPNPGPGGHCAILVFGAHERVVSGGGPDSTNNREELLAVLDGLRALKRPCRVKVVTDSRLVVGWIRDQWRRDDPQCAFLLAEIEQVVKDMGHILEFELVKGHSGHPYNERAHRIAQASIPKLEAA